MANHASAIKRHRQSLRRRDRNRATKSAIRTAVKNVRAAVATGDKSAPELLKVAERMFSKAATKGVFHKNSAARKISRLASAVSASK